jgi:hypothetical protein
MHIEQFITERTYLKSSRQLLIGTRFLLETIKTLPASTLIGHTMNPIALGDTLAREGVVFAGLLGFLLLGAVLILALRTRVLPVCWNCGHPSIRRSESHRVLDTLARACFLHPYRCEKCLQRCYCFRSSRVQRHAHSRSRAASG